MSAFARAWSIWRIFDVSVRLYCFVRARVTGEVVRVMTPAEAERARDRSTMEVRRGPASMVVGGGSNERW